MAEYERSPKPKGVELAFLDDLTNLYNRRFLYRQLPEEIKKAGVKNGKLTLLMIDLDGFKEINDTHGHLEGDRALVELAAILKENTGKAGIVARYAGDEFTIILPGKDETASSSFAEILLKNAAEHQYKKKDGNPLPSFTLSIGLASYPEDAQTSEDLLSQADQALYSSKRSGKNRLTTCAQITQEVLLRDKLRKAFPAALVDRKKEMEKLTHRLSSAEKGEKGWIFIKGDPGVGKTRVMKELEAQAKSREVTAIEVNCLEEGAFIPYGVLKKAILNYFESIPISEVLQIVKTFTSPTLEELIAFIPKLKKLPLEITPLQPASSREKRLRLFKAIGDIIRLISTSRPLLLIIDNAHWLDEASGELLAALLKDEKRMPLFISSAYCPANLRTPSGKDVYLPRLTARLREEGRLEEISLAPFSPEETSELIQFAFPKIKISKEALSRIQKVTGGSPYFLEEMFKFLAENKFIYYEKDRWQMKEVKGKDLPSTLEEVVQKKIAGLDKETRELITEAALIGEEFDFDFLSSLGAGGEGELLELVDRARKSGLIKEKKALSDEQFSFSARTLQDALSEAIPQDEKKKLSENLAQKAEDYYRDNLEESTGKLTRYFEQADNLEKAAEYSRHLTELQSQVFVYEEALGFLDEISREVGIIEDEVAAEEIIEKPLSAESRRHLPELVGLLRSSAINILLYPPDNQARVKVTDKTFEILEKILKVDWTLTFSEVEEKTLVNGEILKKQEGEKLFAATFLPLFDRHEVASFTFKKGISLEEFITFLENLSKKREVFEEGGLKGYLKKQGIDTIKIDEIKYAKATTLARQVRRLRGKLEKVLSSDRDFRGSFRLEGDEIKLDPTLIRESKRAVESLARIVRDIAKSDIGGEEKGTIIAQCIEKIGGEISQVHPRDWQNLKKKITNSVFQLDPKLQVKVLRKAATLAERPDGTIGGVVGNFDESQISGIIADTCQKNKTLAAEILKFYKELSSKDRRFQEVLVKLEGGLRQRGVSQKEIEQLLEGEAEERFSLDEMTAELAKLVPAGAKGITKNARAVIEGLLLARRDDVVSGFLEDVSTQLKKASVKDRTKIARDIKGIVEVLLNYEKYGLLKNIAAAFQETLKNERGSPAYSEIAEVLEEIASGLIYKEEYQKPLAIIKSFKEELRESRSADEKKCIQEVLRGIVKEETIALLVRSLQARGVSDVGGAIEILNELGKEAETHLTKMILKEDTREDPFEVYLRRRNITLFLTREESQAGDRLKDALFSAKPELTIDIIKVFGNMEDKKILPLLAEFLKHKNREVKKTVVSALEKIGGEESKRLLFPALADKEIAADVKESLRKLGEKKNG